MASLGLWRHDPNCEVVLLWHALCDESHATVRLGEQEYCAATRPVLLGYDPRRSGEVGQMRRLGKFRLACLGPKSISVNRARTSALREAAHCSITL
jgi:hypothetical protein